MIRFILSVCLHLVLDIMIFKQIFRSAFVDIVQKSSMSKMAPPMGVPFARAKVGDFLQDQPKLHNPYLSDGPLKRNLKRLLPSEVFSVVEKDLIRFGDRIVSEIDTIGHECEQNPPQLRPHDAWGRRIDRLVTSSAWNRMKTISAEEGLVACGYENRFGEFDRIFQYAKLYLYAPSSGLYSCPLAMSDGAAKVIMEMGPGADDQIKEAYGRLTSRDPDKFWTSGQWMTEKRGGSDVANGTQTVAYPRPDGMHDLYGYKWFSSATDADMALTLARPVMPNESPLEGTKGISLFFVKVRDPSTNELNNIEIVRLKDKLGTKQLPTAELLLDGTAAKKISADGRGVASIAGMMNITRIHNAVSGVGGMRRIVSLSRDYTFRRKVFGKNLIDQPLHVQTLARLEVEIRGNLSMVFEVAKLLGLQEKKKINENQTLLLRLLTPLLKLYNAKMAVPLISEGLESFGGMGYMEDAGLSAKLRDAQVLPIWEGTTNVLSLDVLRHLAKEGERVMIAYKTEIESKISSVDRSVALGKSAKITRASVDSLIQFAMKNTAKLELAARDFAMSLARCYIGALLLEHASSTVATDDDVETAVRWCQPKFMLLLDNEQTYSKNASEMNKALLLDEYYQEKSKL